MDLQQFCSVGDEYNRYRIHRPFSRGAWSWATNGHILVRVARRADIPEDQDAPNAEAVWPKIEPGAWRVPSLAALPPPEVMA